MNAPSNEQMIGKAEWDVATRAEIDSLRQQLSEQNGKLCRAELALAELMADYTRQLSEQAVTIEELQEQLAPMKDGSYGRTLRATIERLEADKARMDWLESAVWTHEDAGNGIAIFPTTQHATGEKGITLQGLGDEDGSNLGDEITPTRPNLRAAIDSQLAGKEQP